MTVFPPLRRSLWYLVSPFLLVLLWIFAIHVEQWVLRYRAGKLLADIRSLELRKSTFADAQAVLRRWRPWVHYGDGYGAEQNESECTPKRCAFWIDLENYLSPVSFYNRWDMAYDKPWQDALATAYDCVGGNNASVGAAIKVENGVVWSKSVGAEVSVASCRTPDGNGGYTLAAQAQTIPRFFPGSNRWETQRLHPDYVVDWTENCKSCVFVWPAFTPYAEPTDVARLTEINLSCFTRWHPCEGREDIMPAAMAEDVRERTQMEKSPMWIECTPKIIELLGRDAEFAAIGRVVSYGKETKPLPRTDDSIHYQALRVRDLEPLKGKLPDDVSSTGIRVDWDHRSIGAHGYNPLGFQPRERKILLFGYRRDSPDASQPWLEICGAIPFTEAHLERVRRGIAQDQRPE